MGCQGRIQDFKLGGTHLKKLRRTKGGAKMLRVLRVKNHDFAPKNKNFPILVGSAQGAPPPLDVTGGVEKIFPSDSLFNN